VTLPVRRQQRSELELFNALDDAATPGDLEEFTDRLRRCVRWVLHRMPSGSTLAGETEDIVAAARLRLEQLRARGFHGGAPEFKSYLYKVVVSACFEAMRQQRFTTSLDLPVSLPDGSETTVGDVLHRLVAPGLGADAVLEQDEANAFVRRALEGLDERCRRLLSGFHLEDVPIRELARREQARDNTIEVALTRCRSRLYIAFLHLYLEGADPLWRERVTKAGAKLSGTTARVFAGWWTDNQSVVQISRELDLTPADTHALLAKAKREVWRVLREERIS